VSVARRTNRSLGDQLPNRTAKCKSVNLSIVVMETKNYGTDRFPHALAL
jgi:hypothetical protein